MANYQTNFISQHDLNRPSTSTKEVEDEDDATDIDEPKEETNDSNDDKMVTEAQKLFGNDIVEVKND